MENRKMNFVKKKVKKIINEILQQNNKALLEQIKEENKALLEQIKEANSRQLSNIEQLIEDDSDFIKNHISYERMRIVRRMSINDDFRETHMNTFPQFKDCNLGKEVVLLATGPTLDLYKPIEDALHIGVNGAIFQDKIKLDYYFTQDYSGMNKAYFEKIITYRSSECIKFFGVLDEPCLIPENFVNQAKAYKYYTNFDSDLMRMDISKHELADFGSVCFAAISFALWTHPKKIYLVGCDCSDDGHYSKNGVPESFIPNKHLVEGWKKVKIFAEKYYPDVEICSINPVGLRGVFNEITQNEL